MRTILKIHPITLKILDVFESLSDAYEITGISFRNIQQVCAHTRYQAGGYFWRYYDEFVFNNHVKGYSLTDNLLNNKFQHNPLDFTLYGYLNNYINPSFLFVPGELWKDVPGYEGLYQISNLGRLISIKYSPFIFLKNPTPDKDGYLQIGLYDGNRIRKTYRLHRIVGFTWISNPNNLPVINHKNEIKSDNRSINLEWCTQKYNVNYGTGLLRLGKTLGKLVEQIDINTGKVINEFWSMNEAARETGIQIANISAVCRGKLRQTGGYIWRFKTI